MLREASIVQDWINEGMEKGEIKALQDAILDILEERFGLLRKNIGKKIKAIDDPALLKSFFSRSQTHLLLAGGQFSYASALPFPAGESH